MTLTATELTAILAVLSGLIWLIRLEGRINLRDALCNAQDARTASLETRILRELEAIRQEIKTDRTELRADVARLFEKIDEKQDKP